MQKTILYYVRGGNWHEFKCSGRCSKCLIKFKCYTENQTNNGIRTMEVEDETLFYKVAKQNVYYIIWVVLCNLPKFIWRKILRSTLEKLLKSEKVVCCK